MHFLLIFLISGCGLGAYKWRAYFLAFISSFYCKKQEKIALNLQAHSLKRVKRDCSQMGKKMCVEKYVLGISFARKAKLKRMLVEYPVKISVKGGRH